MNQIGSSQPAPREPEERLYKSLVEQAMDGILLRRTSGELLFVNESFCRMSGYSRDELLRMNVLELMDASDPDPRLAQLAPGESRRSEGRLRHKSGQVIAVELNMACRTDGDVQIVVRDVGERIEARRHLSEERSLVYNAINSLQGPFFVINIRGDFLLWNKEFEKVSGYDGKEIRCMRPVDFIVPEQREAAAESMQQAIKTGETATAASVLTRDGHHLPYYFVGRRFEYHGETCIAGMGLDISERIAAHKKLKESELLFRGLVNQAVEGVTVRHATGEYVLVNEAFCKMLGYTREQLLRMRLTDVIEPSEQRGHLLKPGESARFDSWMYHKDGHKVFVDVSTLRLPNGDIQSVQRDISERLEAQRKLENSEHQYRELVEQAMLGILVRRPTGEILFVNEALCRITGYSREELLRMSVTKLVDPAEAGAIERVTSVAENEVLRFESRLRHKNGGIVHEELSARRLESGDIQIIVNDITTRVAAEQRLSDERDFVYHALDTLPGVFYVFNSKGKFLRWNRRMEQITGYGTEEMKNITSADIVPPDRRANHARLVAEILSGKGLEGETDLYCKDGTRIPYYYVARPFLWRGQHCVVGMGVDISERKQAERQLAEGYTLLSNAVNSLAGTFYLFTEQGKFLLWNRSLELITGYDGDAIAHMRPLDFIPAEQRTLIAERIGEVFVKGESTAEADLLCRDGRRIPFFFTGQRFVWRGQNCVVGTGTDITDRKETVRRAKIYQEELQQLSRHLLEIQENERRQIARELHDELGQGLTAALINLKELADQPGAAALSPQIEQVSAILTQLTQQVRTLSLNLRPSVLDDLGLTAAVRWYLRERVERMGLKVTLQLDDSLPKRLPMTIETTCFRILQAVLTNVLRHAQARRVEVSLQSTESELRLTIRDDGRGFDIKAARRAAAFGKSFGLLGMEERVSLAGGRFEVISNPGKGTEVHMSLPLSETSSRPAGV